MASSVNLVVLCAAAYLLGAVPFGVLISLRFAKRDVREVGSGNIGATNVVRAAGKRAGAVTLLLDAAKAAAPAYVGSHFFGAAGGALAGGAAFLGHVFPVYLRFRGGKGVAPGLGVFAVLAPLGAGFGLLAYGITLAVTRTSAVSSLSALLVLGATVAFTAPAPVVSLYVCVATVVIFRHRSNLQALVSRLRG